MPLYEYSCDSCTKITEEIQKLSDAPLTECDCGGKLIKIILKTNFELKGAGWHKTDYPKNGN